MCSRKSVFIAAISFLCLALSAEWANNFAKDDPLRAIFWKLAPMPGGAVQVRKSPKETRPALAGHLDLRALEAERDLDFAAAEEDWKKRSPLELADFYHRRNRPMDEIQALAGAGKQPSLPAEKLTPAQQQASWKAFERIFVLIDDQALPPATGDAYYQSWMERYPKEEIVPKRYFSSLVKQKQYAVAEALIVRFQRDHPDDREFPTSARASLAEARGGRAEALTLYGKSFDPLWPPSLQDSYFKLLSDSRSLRTFLAQARTDAEKAPEDIAPVGRMYFYYLHQENPAAARRALVEYRARKETRHAVWKASELRTLARLFEASKDYVEAARAWKLLADLPNDAAAAEDGTAGLIFVLLTAPEQPITFGMEDLTFLRDVGTMDPYPGFFNGLLSMVLNGDDSGAQFDRLEREHSASYFHRAKAAELLEQFEKRFPRSERRAPLRAQLIDAYAVYGSDSGVIAAGTKYLTDFPAGGGPRPGRLWPEENRIGVALRMAESYAGRHRERDEFALYDGLLKELSDAASNVPLGDQASVPPPASDPNVNPNFDPNAQANGRGNRGSARSPEYARILDRYVARLVSLRRVTDATALYRREIDHNPSDPGLYERLAAFLDQNRRAGEIEETYRLAIQRFPDNTWKEKLARWYLRERRQSDFERLTREVTAVFSGSDLESYVREVTAGATIDPVLYRQINLAAHDRFPNNLAFVNNLLRAYTNQPTHDAKAWEALMRQYWPEDAALRNQFLQFLASNGRLQSEIDAVKALPANAGFNGAAALFTAEAEIIQCHYEAATLEYDKLATEDHGNPEVLTRAANLHRSLSYVGDNAERAVALEESMIKLDPRDHGALTRAGEIQADRERYGLAKPYWDRIPAIEPGRAEGYLEAATIFWDYYQFNDALRLIAKGRTQLHHPALYAYEAGAIYENRREYPKAVAEYLRGALESDTETPSRRRLVRLARRKELRPLIEAAAARPTTASPASRAVASQSAASESAASPALARFALRVALLSDASSAGAGRREDLQKYLGGLAATSTSFDILTKVEQEAARQGMDQVHQKAIEREIAINKDPVEDIRLRLTLAGLEESTKHTDAARATMQALYRDHPTILGVVRSTVDYYWRHKDSPAAIDLLLKAADASYPEQKRSFIFEAARKATDTKDFPRARTLLVPLMQEQPFSGAYLAAMAATYSEAGDDTGLRDFYASTIQSLRDAKLPAEERITRTAAMRRGLIPALVRLKDFTGALDQYIEILNRFPEDAALARDAGGFAARNNLRPRLIDYYTKTAAASPRDFHWPLVLARLRTQFEDFTTAIGDYGTALAIRPDRSDLWESRAALEERLLRFADAIRDYQHLYDLSYHDPNWMLKTAEDSARLGRTQECIAALRTALIEGRPVKAANDYEVARRLESWNLVEEALPFVEAGKAQGGDPDAIYFTVLTRLRRYDTVLAAIPAEGSSPSTAMKAIGMAAAKYYTPEEKSALAAAIDKLDQSPRLLPLIAAADLTNLQARRLYDLAIRNASKPEESGQYMAQLAALQTSRLKYDELGSQWEEYWKKLPNGAEKDAALDQAIQALYVAGNADAEYRLLETRFQRGNAGPSLDRYLTLLYARSPRRVIDLARSGSGSDLRNAAASTVLAGGNPQLTREAMSARGAGISPAWTRAYTGLAGLYLADASPEVNDAFVALLDSGAPGSGTIGQRLGKRLDRREQLAGDTWFYYGSRYGEYLDVNKRPNAEDYLPSTLEARPSSATAYLTLADYYAEKSDAGSALADYDHVTDLQPSMVAPYNRSATLLWKQGRRDEAIERWKKALALCEKAAENPRQAAMDITPILVALKEAGVFPQVRAETDRTMRAFFFHNGAFLSDPALRAAVDLGGVDWLVELSAAPSQDTPDQDVSNQEAILANLLDQSWIPAAGRELLFRRVLDLAAKNVAQTFGNERTQAQDALRTRRIQYLRFLLRTRQTARAAETMATLERENEAASAALEPLQIKVAALSGTLDALLSRYQRDPDRAPADDVIRRAAFELRKENNADAARKLLEFAYQRELEKDNPPASAFLGLAEVRLETSDAAGAMGLLRRVNLIAGEPFDNLMPAARLLLRFNHPAEAAEFLAMRLQAVPWDFDAKLATARSAPTAGNTLAAIGADPRAPYAIRADAAGADPSATAAKIVDANARLRAYLDVIANAPDNHAARLAVFRAAIATNHDALALAAMQPLQQSSNQRYTEEGENMHVEEPDAEWDAEIRGPSFLSAIEMPDAQRAALAADLARVNARLGNSGAAANFFRIAAQIDSAGAAPWKREAEALAAESKRRASDLARRPQIKVPLEQDHVVRPRLIPAQERRLP